MYVIFGTDKPYTNPTEPGVPQNPDSRPAAVK
jgi:hypothetical protein